MLFAIIADQRLADRLQRGMAPRVAIGGQHRRVTLPGYDRADDGHAGRTGDVGHHVMKLQVHLHQRLLHVLDVRGGIVQQSLALAQIGPHGCNLAFQPEAGSEQAVFMQPLQPSRGSVHTVRGGWSSSACSPRSRPWRHDPRHTSSPQSGLAGARPAAPRRPVVIKAIYGRNLDPDDGADHPEAGFIDRDAAVVPPGTRRPRLNYPLRHQAFRVKSP